MYPIAHQDMFDMYKKAIQVFWTLDEIDLSDDIRDFQEKLTEEERHFIEYILAFFAVSDGIVMENISMNFLQDVQFEEAKAFYAAQMFMETIHAETYSALLDTLVKDDRRKQMLFESVKNIPSIEKKVTWAEKWMDPKSANFPERLVAFAIVEGIFFSGSFCAIFWLKKRSVMPGLTFSNELISRDEGLHCQFAILLYSKLKDGAKLSNSSFLEILTSAVDIEKEFICSALSSRLQGMNSDSMSKYIEFVADRLCIDLGYSKLYDTPNPFDFMEMISLQGKTNFFEKRVSDYSKVRKIDNEPDFNLNIDF